MVNRDTMVRIIESAKKEGRELGAKEIGEECWVDFVRFSTPTEKAERNINYDDWKNMCQMKYAVGYLGLDEVLKRLKELK